MYEFLITFIKTNFITLNPANTGRVIFKTVAEVVEEFVAAGNSIAGMAEEIDSLTELQDAISRFGEDYVRYIMLLFWGTEKEARAAHFVKSALQFEIPICRISGGNYILSVLTGHMEKEELITMALARV